MLQITVKGHIYADNHDKTNNDKPLVSSIEVINGLGSTIITSEHGNQWVNSFSVSSPFSLAAIIYGAIIPWYYNVSGKSKEYDITLTINTK